MHLCVSVLVSVSVSMWVSARYPVAVLQCLPLVQRVWSRRRAVCCGSTVAFSETIVLCQSPSGCGIFGSAGIFSVCMFLGVACPLLPQFDVCSPACMDFSGSVLCAKCHSLFCDYVATENGWENKCREEVKRERSISLSPSPLPKHTKKYF